MKDSIPNPFINPTSAEQVGFGIDLRDYFAAYALMGILARGSVGLFPKLAVDSYTCAEAMLEERAKRVAQDEKDNAKDTVEYGN